MPWLFIGPAADVGKIHAVIFIPGRVEDTVTVHRGQVFAPLAVHVQLDGNYRAAAFSMTRSWTVCSAAGTRRSAPVEAASSGETATTRPPKGGNRLRGGLCIRSTLGSTTAPRANCCAWQARSRSGKPGAARPRSPARGRAGFRLEQAVLVQPGWKVSPSGRVRRPSGAVASAQAASAHLRQ